MLATVWKKKTSKWRGGLRGQWQWQNQGRGGADNDGSDNNNGAEWREDVMALQIEWGAAAGEGDGSSSGSCSLTRHSWRDLSTDIIRQLDVVAWMLGCLDAWMPGFQDTDTETQTMTTTIIIHDDDDAVCTFCLSNFNEMGSLRWNDGGTITLLTTSLCSAWVRFHSNYSFYNLRCS